MPTYAILGATGATGGSILTLLLAQSPRPTIHIYVRSPARLHAAFPTLRDAKNVHIHSGALTNVSVIKECVSTADAVFATAATNGNTPGNRIAQDTANVLIAAFCQMRTENPEAKLPTVVVLSSSTLNAEYSKATPRLGLWLVERAVSNVYADLRLAEQIWRMHEGWLKVIFVQPGGLVEDEQRGHVVLLEKATRPLIGYKDLAAGMIEIAERKEEFVWKGVNVAATSDDVQMKLSLPLNLLKGLLWRLVPYTW